MSWNNPAEVQEYQRDSELNREGAFAASRCLTVCPGILASRGSRLNRGFAGSFFEPACFSAARRVSWNKFDHPNAIKVTQSVGRVADRSEAFKPVQSGI